jgi:RNA polymerase sigma factor (sigma-70 family)
LPTAPDIELWNAFKQGNRKAFTELFEVYYPLLIQYGIKICPERALLEDCIQELFVELWQAKSSSEPKSVKAYLLRALKYKIFRQYRHQNLSVRIEDDMLFEISHEEMLVRSDEEKQKAIRITNAIQQLPTRQREIIYLKLYQQLNYEELSEVMQINYQATRNLFYQAIRSLRNILR